MTKPTLTDAATRLLQRIAGAHPEPFQTSPRGRPAADELVEAGLIGCTDKVCALTPAGVEALGLAAVPVAGRAPREGSKAAQVIALLSRPEGATIAQLSETTGWLPHSVRGFLAGALRRAHGLTPISSRAEDVRIYRLAS